MNQYDAKTFIRKCLLKRLANEKTREIRSLKKKKKLSDYENGFQMIYNP